MGGVLAPAGHPGPDRAAVPARGLLRDQRKYRHPLTHTATKRLQQTSNVALLYTNFNRTYFWHTISPAVSLSPHLGLFIMLVGHELNDIPPLTTSKKPLCHTLHLSATPRRHVLLTPLCPLDDTSLQAPASAVLAAVHSSRLGQLRRATRRRADGCLRDAFRFTPLHHAVLGGDTPVVRHLVQDFPDAVNLVDNVSHSAQEPTGTAVLVATGHAAAGASVTVYFTPHKHTHKRCANCRATLIIIQYFGQIQFSHRMHFQLPIVLFHAIYNTIDKRFMPSVSNGTPGHEAVALTTTRCPPHRRDAHHFTTRRSSPTSSKFRTSF